MKVHRSRHPDIAIPQVDILSLLFDSTWGRATEETKIHVEAANPANFITKAQARVLTKRIAYVLRRRYGIGANGPGKDAVFTAIDGSPFAPVFFYGIVAAGGVFCGANLDAQIDEQVRQVRDAEAGLLVCSEDGGAKAIGTAKRCRISRDRVLMLESNAPRWRLVSAETGRDVLADESEGLLDWDRITDSRVLESTTVALLYSSGTTGLPKGVRMAHSGLVANNVCTMDPAIRYSGKCEAEGKTFRFDTIAHLPMANIAGISLYSTNPFYMGGTTYWMKKYNYDDFIAYHRRFRPAYQFSVPPIWLRIAKDDNVTDHFDGLQVAVTGSAPVGEGTVREVQRKLGKGKALFAQTWGTTETSGVITALDWPEMSNTGTWSVGELCPNVRLRVVDDDGEDIPDGETGELLISGPILTQGYHKRPDANRDTFVDGWYRSGDVGLIRNGHVSIVDRKKELIKYKGAQVAPAELEALLVSHPEIMDAAVIGMWSEEQQTEVPRGYVVRRDGSSVSANAVVEFVKSRVARYKQLQGGVVFVDEIPKSASGKILRKELRQVTSGHWKPKL